MARLHCCGLAPSSRRVIVKARLVRLKAAGTGAVAAHLRYVVRDGVTRNGEVGQAYGAGSDTADLESFEARGRKDRHQFRLIVAPEDAVQLEDLRGFTRDLMNQMEVDLGTRLDWVAVDHWDTDNPHIHVVLRGKDQAGRDLIIAREYISYGLRNRASELATGMLGQRSEREIRASMAHEVEQERWTSLDRELQFRSRDGAIDLRDLPGNALDRYRRSLLIGRLQRVATMGLADELAPGSWRLRPDAEQTLRSLGERGDIIRTMQRAFGREQRELAIFDPARASAPVVGRIAGKGLIDEISDRAYVIIDAIDGRVHHVALAAATDLDDLSIGGIVEARGVSERAVDRRIAGLAEHGVYSTEVHLAELNAAPGSGRDPEAVVEAHVRRLEALRRARIVERIADGLWRVPDDLPARGLAYDRQRLGGSAVELLSHIPIEKQVHALGATWLDRQLVEGARGVSERGFGSDVRQALDQREDFLVAHGFAERIDARVVLGRKLLATLRNREINETAKRIAAETGLTHQPLLDGDRVEGVYRRSVLLASGRFAMLDDGLRFSLVPWRPLIEKRLGQNVAAAVNGDNVSWLFGRKLTRSS
jgi:type IV secretory pathway VirD2 relaxase